MKQVRHGVVALNGVAAGGIHAQGDLRADHRGVATLDEMQEGVARLLGIGDAPELAGTDELAGVADLAAHLGIAHRGVEDDGGAVLQLDDLQDLGAGLQGVIAGERRRGLGLDLGQFDDLLLLGGAGAGALLFHSLLEAGLVHRQAAFAGHELGEVEGETIGVVEEKSYITADNSRLTLYSLTKVPVASSEF